MKKLPVDVSSFATLINENYIYVDKTPHIFQLITSGRLYFLSRPRRFGKSLLISTLLELFSANKKLFKGLWIETSSYDWPEYPVLHFDFSLLAYETSEKLEISLSWLITHIALKFGIDVSDAPFPGNKLQVLIEELRKKNKVVVLIDEYDYPIINSLPDIELTIKNRTLLRQFFSTLKSLDGHLRAIFLTGVSKFSKTSIFSGFNNLNDISMDPIASLLLGYTKEEVEHFFSDHLKKCSKEMNKKKVQLLSELTTWYDGYRFSKQENYVFNPFSVLYFLQKRKFANYWLTSGTPSFLLKLLKEQYYEMINLEELALPEESLGSFELDTIPLVPLLYQTGYLTIKHYDPNKNLYKLNIPNFEVGESFKEYLLATFAGADSSTVKSALPRLKAALRQEDVALFMSILQILIAHIPYQLHIPEERYYHSLFQLLLSMLSEDVQSEVCTDKGRIDLVIKKGNTIFLFEIKFEGTSEEALRQIDNKKYYERFLLHKKIFLIGVSFNRLNETLHLDYKFKRLNHVNESGRIFN